MTITKQGAQDLMLNYYKVNNCDMIAERAVEILVKFGVDELVAFAYAKGREEAKLEQILGDISPC